MVGDTPQVDSPSLTVIGGGLAGCEAAWQAAAFGCRVRLFEMRPQKTTPAHETGFLAELVCSNSFRSDDGSSAVGLLKEEMRQLDSLIMVAAQLHRVPAGKALAVDRAKFAQYITEAISAHPLITVIKQEVVEIPDLSTVTAQNPVILATGPLTSDPMAQSLGRLTGQKQLSFYDAIAPIIVTDSVDKAVIYQASRYDDGPGDYLNCPMNREEYEVFITAMKEAQTVPLKSFEDKNYFEGCLPIEVMVERGDDTPRFGPMKPVGLPDPRTGRDPYAVVQLRFENQEGSHVNMVGFQTKLTYAEQKRVFTLIPGLKNAEFSRLGSIHRNTFICAPELLDEHLLFKGSNGLFIAGQLSGVEGYVESTAMGLIAGINAASLMHGYELKALPPETAHGALMHHLTQAEAKRFQPSNVNFGLFPAIGKKMPKRLRGEYRAEKAVQSFSLWKESNQIFKQRSGA
nr:methylenetetrahydrofolate--tRNA-(uracil(54)-C(5))-methyltransferase (FADH(2)-oxidizing) TrmFO [Desulfobulbaceae bacterium]